QSSSDSNSDSDSVALEHSEPLPDHLEQLLDCGLTGEVLWMADIDETELVTIGCRVEYLRQVLVDHYCSWHCHPDVPHVVDQLVEPDIVLIDVFTRKHLETFKFIIQLRFSIFFGELRSRNKNFNIVPDCFCFNVVIDKLVDVFGAVDNGEKLYMGNSATSNIKGEGDVIRNMTSEKELKSTNVLYVIEIHKNLVSGWLLNKFGFRLVFEFDNKDEAIDKFVLYKTEVENQLGRKIKVVRSDRGGEYVSPFVDLCAKHGIKHEFNTPYSPQQNGISERKNRTLKEMVNAMLISSGLTQDMWCLAKVDVLTPKAQKIGHESVDCIIIGYAKNSSAYHFIVHDSKDPNIQKNTVMESRNASFFENVFPCLTKKTESSSRIDDEVVQDKRQRDDNDLQDERQDQPEVEPRRSKRARTEKSFEPDFVSFMVENEPTSYQEVVTPSEGHQWK
ncbi:retrotransposon protein, putative, ty1-copia subclass, partial [Tanacetum coccineum]